MKHRVICLMMLLAGCCSAFAQRPQPLSGGAALPSWNLEITAHKTTVLIFPAPVQSADRGDAYILAEKVPGVENVLKVKAGEKDFEQSNLHVVTTDGNVYAFTLNYSDSPAETTYDLRRQRPYGPVAFQGTSLNSAELKALAEKVAGRLPFLHGSTYKKYGLRFSLTGTYIKDNVLFFQFQLHNSTHLPLREGSLRFYVRDKKKPRRTAERDNEMEPLLIYRSGIPENGKGQTLVVALPQFTIAESKRFIVELMEADGDRNPTCIIKQKQLLKAKAL